MAGQRIAGRRAVLATVAIGLLVAGCSSGSHRVAAGPAPSGEPAAGAPCASWQCAPAAEHAIGDGYALRLWTSPAPSTGDPAVTAENPVVELLHHHRHVAWWNGRLGNGRTAQLTCEASACAVTSTLGAHGGMAETLLRDGDTLLSPAAASVEFDTGIPLVTDLDGDGGLDVLGKENDYTPNFAQGHDYWATYRLTGRALVRSGCARVTPGGAVPSKLLTGTCPAVPGG